MKFLICLFFAAMCFSSSFGQVSIEAIDSLQKDEKHCVQLSGVSSEHMDMIRLGRKIYEDENQEKFAVCMLKKFNIINMDGSINRNESNYILLSDNPMAYETARNCVALAGENVRESARKIMTCLMHTYIIVMNPIPSAP